MPDLCCRFMWRGNHRSGDPYHKITGASLHDRGILTLSDIIMMPACRTNRRRSRPQHETSFCGDVRQQNWSATPFAFQMTFPIPMKHWKESKIYSYSAFKFKFHLIIWGDVSLLFLTSFSHYSKHPFSGLPSAFNSPKWENI